MPKIGYLSGAPRVSTKPEAAAAGPRAHIVGTMTAFKNLGWEVKPFIVGDLVPVSWINKDADKIIQSNAVKQVFLDSVRLSMAYINEYRAINRVGKVDWVYERFGTFQLLGRRFQRKNIPWILETNGLFFSEAKYDRQTLALDKIAKQRELTAYKNADIIITISEQLKNLIIEHNINPEKIIVTPNGVDTKQFNPYIIKNPIRKFSIPTIGFVGGLIAWQGIDLLLNAIYKLKNKGILYGLTIVGDGLIRKDLEKLASSLNLDEQVYFVGRVAWKDVPHYIAGFDLAYSAQLPIYTGSIYHSPLKLYEYMAMAKPILASSFQDALKVLSHRENAYIFDIENADSLVQALEYAYYEKSRWKKMGEQARQQVTRLYSWEARVHSMVEEIEHVLRID